MGDGVAGTIPLLAQRAASEGPRWTRAVGAHTGHLLLRGEQSGVERTFVLMRAMETIPTASLDTGERMEYSGTDDVEIEDYH